MSDSQRARIIRVPVGAGANNYRGLELGPHSVERLTRDRIADFQLDATSKSTRIPFRYWLDEKAEEIEAVSPGDAEDTGEYETIQHLPAVSEICRRLREKVADVLGENRDDPILPLVLGGDHSIAIGTIAGLRKARPNKKLGLLWIDSHSDYHTGYFGERFGNDEYDRWHRSGPAEKNNRKGTTFSGHIHGMALAVSCGYGEPKLLELFEQGNFVAPENVVCLGLRDIDREEKEWLFRDKVYCISSRQIGFHGVPDCVHRAVKHLLQKGVEELHISFDIDCLESVVVPGTGTRVPGGMSFREADLVLKLLRDWLPEVGIRVCSFDLVEVNPTIDKHGRTAHLAARLLTAFLGEEILYHESFAWPGDGP
ncbi:MAG TPA: arginase [Acidobacteriota bacterium]|nr:arginase [Acidobacteriota bacterium]